jgi:hypothetical protein
MLLQQAMWIARPLLTLSSDVEHTTQNRYYWLLSSFNEYLICACYCAIPLQEASTLSTYQGAAQVPAIDAALIGPLEPSNDPADHLACQQQPKKATP